MNSYKMEKKRYPGKAAIWFAIVCIAAVLSGCRDELPHPKGILPLSTSLIVPAQPDAGAAPASVEIRQALSGQRQTPADAAAEGNLPQWHRVRMRVTAYCACPVCCGRLAAGRTANGHIIQQGERFVAADKKYPFGTEIIVPHYNGERPIRVLDRGGAIHGNRLDIFFSSHARAIKWGVKYLDVRVRTKSEVDD
jgi:3D (Asp-Asp-Asp) domain-containing protein